MRNNPTHAVNGTNIDAAISRLDALVDKLAQTAAAMNDALARETPADAVDPPVKPTGVPGASDDLTEIMDAGEPPEWSSADSTPAAPWSPAPLTTDMGKTATSETTTQNPEPDSTPGSASGQAISTRRDPVGVRENSLADYGVPSENATAESDRLQDSWAMLDVPTSGAPQAVTLDSFVSGTPAHKRREVIPDAYASDRAIGYPYEQIDPSETDPAETPADLNGMTDLHVQKTQRPAMDSSNPPPSLPSGDPDIPPKTAASCVGDQAPARRNITADISTEDAGPNIGTPIATNSNGLTADHAAVIISLLTRLVGAAERGSNGSGNNARIGEAVGALAGMLSQKSFGPSSVPGTN